MTLDTDAHAFLWLAGGFLAALTSSLVLPALGYSLLFALPIWAVYCAVVVGFVVLFRKAPLTVGGPARFGDSRFFRAVRWVFGVHLLDCGCLCIQDWDNLRRPVTETLDSTPVWLRSERGAKVRFVAGREQWVRCENCGNRYMKTTKNTDYRGTAEASQEYWLDDPAPFPDDDREILEDRDQ